MAWLLTAHVRRYQKHYRTTGHIYQGRFKSFPIEADDHLLTVLRYVERNALRARLVAWAEDWRWGSLWRRTRAAATLSGLLHEGPVAPPDDWVGRVNTVETEAELEAARQSVGRGRPFGSELWCQTTAQALGLQKTLRPLGRPRKAVSEQEAMLF
jgi:putative transposase